MKRTFLFACICYSFCAAILFPYIKDYADNADTFQYIEVAQKYLSGNWHYAVNGYWSPLISWLLIIPISLFKSEVYAFKALQFLIGFFTLYSWHRLVDLSAIQLNRKKVLVYFSIPFILHYGLLNLTPDLLFLGLLLLLAVKSTKGNLFSTKKEIFLTAFIGVLLYLTKAFGFPFFIAFIAGILIRERIVNGKNGTLLKKATVLFTAFFLICSVWVIILSLHYGKFTLSEAAAFNRSIDVAPLPGRLPELPVLDRGLYQPEEHAVSAWETPGVFVSKEQVTLFHSPADFLQIVKRNLLSVYYYDFRHQPGIVFFILLLLFIAIRGIRMLYSNRWLFVCLFLILLIYGGYSMILVHTRYTWINTWLMILLSVYFIEELFSIPLLKKTTVFVFVFLLAWSVKRPVKEIFFTNDKSIPPLWFWHMTRNPFTTLWIHYKTDIQLQQAIEKIGETGFRETTIASLKSGNTERDSYVRALRISRNGRSRYFGQVDSNLSFQQQQEELISKGIRFLLTFDNTPWGNKTPGFYDADSGIGIYEVKQ